MFGARLIPLSAMSMSSVARINHIAGCTRCFSLRRLRLIFLGFTSHKYVNIAHTNNTFFIDMCTLYLAQGVQGIILLHFNYLSFQIHENLCLTFTCLKFSHFPNSLEDYTSLTSFIELCC